MLVNSETFNLTTVLATAGAFLFNVTNEIRAPIDSFGLSGYIFRKKVAT